MKLLGRTPTKTETASGAVAITLGVVGIVLSLTVSPGQTGIVVLLAGVVLGSYVSWRQLWRQDLEDSDKRSAERKRRLG
jgi:hypothetical protein